MADLTPCPTCSAMLRIPAGAAMIRCPNCKTVLSVEAEPEPAPAAPPLPFGRPTAPSGPAPVARQVAPPGRKTAGGGSVRARLAPVTDSDLARHSGDSDEAAERRRKMRRELQKLEERERRLAERYKELVEHCKHGRIGVQLLMWGIRAQALAVLTLVAGMIGTIAVSPAYGGLLAWTCVATGGIASCLIIGGFGFAIAGPEKGRHIGIMGILVSLIFAILVVLQFLAGMVVVLGSPFEPQTWADTLPLWRMFAPGTEMAMLSEQPARALKGYPFTIIGSIAAALEFTRLVLLALLIQVYAAEAKEAESGHQAIATASNLFWVVLLAAMFRVSAAFGFDWAQPNELWAQVGIGVHVSISIGCLVGIGLAYFKLSQVMDDVADIVDPRRFVETDEKSV